MKRSDIIFILFLLAIFIPFFISDNLYSFYKDFNANYPFLISFIKFALLATLGELLGLRIRHGKYFEKGFGIIPRAIVWGTLGVSIKMAFIVFGEGAPMMLQVMGLHFPVDPPFRNFETGFLFHIFRFTIFVGPCSKRNDEHFFRSSFYDFPQNY